MPFIFLEMTKKVDIKSQKDETIKGAFWNIIRFVVVLFSFYFHFPLYSIFFIFLLRLLHQKVISSIKDEKSLEHSEGYFFCFLGFHIHQKNGDYLSIYLIFFLQPRNVLQNFFENFSKNLTPMNLFL